MVRWILLGFLLIVTQGIGTCNYAHGTSSDHQQPESALLPVRSGLPLFNDDMEFDSLILALQRNLRYLRKVSSTTSFQYGPDSVSCSQVQETQETFLRLIAGGTNTTLLNHIITEKFRIYRAAGTRKDSRVLFTGYYEPLLEARKQADGSFKYPIYRKPDDMVTLNLSNFDKRLPSKRLVGMVRNGKILPYYTRSQIDGGKVLENRGLEIAWLDNPVDIAILQIQGSGRLRLKDDSIISLNYEASNGHPYQSIGSYMLRQGYLDRRSLSLGHIKRFLLTNTDLTTEILHQNPAYVFFKVSNEGPLGNINVPLTYGRSVALDDTLFPKGALGYISCKKPQIDRNGKISRWVSFSRFVLNQDTGSDIRGAGRADLFWGSGDDAEVAAGNFKHHGSLYVLVKK
ncbi:MAG: MltA domain-containing protein [Desulfobacterales bacterium]|nr:MltA domain-containing protein [Desulfobacterales bacterium]